MTLRGNSAVSEMRRVVPGNSGEIKRSPTLRTEIDSRLKMHILKRPDHQPAGVQADSRMMRARIVDIMLLTPNCRQKRPQNVRSVAGISFHLNDFHYAVQNSHRNGINFHFER
jgi:hypothetical protein